MGYDVLIIPRLSTLAPYVNSHPDMILCKIGDRVVVNKNYYFENSELFRDVSVIPTDSIPALKYPSDVTMNGLVLGDTVYGRVDVLCSEILNACTKKVFVKQGYAACSCAVVAENAVITADKSLYNALTKNKVEVCLVKCGNILLEGCDYGFVGGASVKINDSTLAFFGKIEEHPDYERMRDFAAGFGVSLLSLSDEPLTDCGGGFLYER